MKILSRPVLFSRAAFTLIELLISVSIIATLIAIGVASYATVNKQSRDTKRKSDLEQLRSALEMYRAENGSYPAAGCAVASCSFVDASGLAGSLVSTYIPSIPTDPRDTGSYKYYYQPTAASGGLYYGYCLSGTLEAVIPADNTCTPNAAESQNFGMKNP